MSAHGLTLAQAEEFRDALLENKSDFGVTACTLAQNDDPLNRDEWGVRITYEFDLETGAKETSTVTVFEDYKLAGIMHALYERASK